MEIQIVCFVFAACSLFPCLGTLFLSIHSLSFSFEFSAGKGNIVTQKPKPIMQLHQFHLPYYYIHSVLLSFRFSPETATSFPSNEMSKQYKKQIGNHAITHFYYGCIEVVHAMHPIKTPHIISLCHEWQMRSLCILCNCIQFSCVISHNLGKFISCIRK